MKGTFNSATTTSTIGASFLTKRVLDVDSGTIVRLQLWDTAGQERFRSLSKLYYRGASAILLVYSITDEQSFDEMGRWLLEVQEQVADDIIIHVVGTKNDVVLQDSTERKVPFERCIAYVAENLNSSRLSTPAQSAGGASMVENPESKGSSGFGGQDLGWDCCHEISAKDGEGIDEVFRVITRKLVDHKAKYAEREPAAQLSTTPSGEPGQLGYFDAAGRGSFRLGVGDKRRSWLGFPTPHFEAPEQDADAGRNNSSVKAGSCC